MSGMNILKKYHGALTLAVDAVDATAATIANLTEINCNGYTKLMVQYIVSSASWDRAGTITIYGAYSSGGTYTAMDSTVENATHGVLHTDDGLVGLGEIYFVENIAPYIKIGWTNTTAGTAGTISIWVMPFND